jgi:hypothetical protein
MAGMFGGYFRNGNGWGFGGLGNGGFGWGL